jgi:hypothetical protein
MEKFFEQGNFNDHLKEGVSPIIVCIGTEDEHDYPEREDLTEEEKEKLKRIITPVNFYEEKELLDKGGFDNAGKETYVISKIDDTSKLTMELFSCTCIVAVGIDKNTGGNISMLTHQNPTSFLHENKEDFYNHLTSKLKELKERSEEKTVDIIILGGNVYDDEKFPPGENYSKSIEFLSSIVLKVFGFTPVVIAGPKGIPEGKAQPDHVMFDNERRRVYLERPRDFANRLSVGDFRLNPDKLTNIDKIS